MKFYYEGKLIRTSKNHVYTHAVIDMASGKLIGCRASEDAARSVISSEISSYKTGIKNTQSMQKAIEQGKRMYRVTEGRRSCYMPIDSGDTLERCREWIEYREKAIERIRKDWKVVELEARA